VPPPTVAVSLSATAIEAGKDTVDLTWSSTGAASCEYGSASLAASGRRTIGPFSAGTHDITVNCAGTGGTSSDTARLTATSADPDTDGDGIPDAQDPDDDNDGMPDIWELANKLNPLDASDASRDEDSDGHTNLAEYKAGSDPRWVLSKPGSIPQADPGFNSSYTAQKGLIDNDQLMDILIRNPTNGVLPAVSDFVLIQQPGGGFKLRDADDFKSGTAPRLTPISQAIRLHDLNADGVTDLLLRGLDRHIQDADDHLIFGNHSDQYVIPGNDVQMTDHKTEFFEQVVAWLKDDDYFYNNAPAAALVPAVVEAESGLLVNRQTGQVLIGEQPSTHIPDTNLIAMTAGNEVIIFNGKNAEIVKRIYVADVRLTEVVVTNTPLIQADGY